MFVPCFQHNSRSYDGTNPTWGLTIKIEMYVHRESLYHHVKIITHQAPTTWSSACVACSHRRAKVNWHSPEMERCLSLICLLSSFVGIDSVWFVSSKTTYDALRFQGDQVGNRHHRQHINQLTQNLKGLISVGTAQLLHVFSDEICPACAHLRS